MDIHRCGGGVGGCGRLRCQRVFRTTGQAINVLPIRPIANGRHGAGGGVGVRRARLLRRSRGTDVRGWQLLLRLADIRIGVVGARMRQRGVNGAVMRQGFGARRDMCIMRAVRFCGWGFFSVRVCVCEVEEMMLQI